MTREEAFKRLEQMYDFYAHAMDANKNYPLKGDAEAIKVALLVMAQDRSSHITREQVEKMRGEWDYPECEWNLPKCPKCGCNSKDATYGHKSNFCPRCGAPMTDKAVDMVMERLEAMKDG